MNEHNSEKSDLFDEDDILFVEKKYDFISLKLYANKEILQEDNRKYRNVFQGPEVDYIYAEYSFHNLCYRIADWEVTINFKIVSIETGDTLAEFTSEETVYANESICRIGKGYGNKIKGIFWKKGTYKWYAWIEENNSALQTFYIEDRGYAENSGMPYMMLEEVKLFDDDRKDENLFGSYREYFKCFNIEHTKAVDVELTARNLLKDSCPWAGEFIFLFKTELGEQKAELRKVGIYRYNDTKINLNVIHKKKLNFSEGIYYVEVIFMEKLIARIPFKIGKEQVRTSVEEHRNFFPDKKHFFRPNRDEKDIFAELNDLIGLEDVKETVSNQLTYFKYLSLKDRRGFGKNEKINLNSLFIGNPGTGKTVVAKMLGRIYRDIGLLSSGHVYEVGRPELVAEYIGHTALKVKEAIEKARGGVLFIDEAYSLAREKDNKRDFGAEVIEVLMKEMSDGPGDIAIIAAGYSEEMKIFLDSNSGLKSRFKHTFEFKDYTPDELMEIAEYHCRKKHLRLTKGAYERLHKTVIKEWRKRDKTFGNARFVNELIDKAEMNLSLRVMRYNNIEKAPKFFITRLEAWDFVKNEANNSPPSSVKLPIDEEGLSEALAVLNSLRGLGKVKDDIEKLTKLIRFYKEEGRDYMSNISLHSAFTGNPGTGKTTVARIMAKIFCSLGILERGHLVECSRESLVSGYTGQTAIKTAKIIEKAIGGVLFIDEAYSLSTSNDNDYGKEVIETLLKKMEDRRGEFIVICAGYSEQMRYFLESNPGLRSRFDRVIEFSDYDDEELIDIAFDLLKYNNLKIYDEIAYLNFLLKVRELYKGKGKIFANAREVRKFVEQIVINQNLRISEIPKSKRTDKIKSEVILEDFNNIIFEFSNNKQPLGFTKS